MGTMPQQMHMMPHMQPYMMPQQYQAGFDNSFESEVGPLQHQLEGRFQPIPGGRSF